MAEDARLTYGTQVSTLRDAFSNTDKAIHQMFQELNSKIEEVHNVPDAQMDAKFDKLIAVEYLIVRVRSRVMTELANVQAALSTSGGSSLDRVIKDRYNSVIIMCQRLNEFRDDISVIQRSMYSRTFGRA